jgi:glucose-1-phosphate adenylyltransferase
MHPNIVILAGGISSRMRSPSGVDLDPRLSHEAASRPKGMIGVGAGDEPFLNYLLINVSLAGYRNVVMVVAEHDESIRAYYGDGPPRFPDLSISYAEQPIPPGRTKPLGTADALQCALHATPSWRGRNLTVCNSDNLYSVLALRLLLEIRHSNALIDYDRAALRFSEERIAQFAVIRKDERGYVRDIAEKPSSAQIARFADPLGRVGVSMNIFRFTFDQIAPVLERVPLHPERQEKELPAAVRLLIAERPQSVYAIPLSEHVIDLTDQSDIPSVQRYLREHFPPRPT